MRRLALAFWVFAAVGCEEQKLARKATTQSPARSAGDQVKTLPHKSQPHSESPKGSANSEQNPPPPIKSPAVGFEEAWTEAEKLGLSADKAEPVATEKALGRLTSSERVEASNAMLNPGLYLERGAADLKRLGLTEWLARESRKKSQDSPEFKGVARKLWDPSTGSSGILTMMNTWGEIPLYHLRGMVRRVQDGAPAARMTPEERNAILLLGGVKWLDDHR